MVLPGPEAQQLATYIGWLMHGVWGGIAAGVLFVLPSLFILIALTWIYLVFGDVSVVAGVLYGIKPAVTAIVLFAAFRIGSKALTNNVLRFIAILAFLSIFALHIPFPYIVLVAGIVGFLGSKIAKDKFQLGEHSSDKGNYGIALIDDDTPIPSHAKFKLSRFVTYLFIGLLIGVVIMMGLIMTYGLEGTLTQMGVFFTKAALVTFGGAYAVLPYVYQGGVEQFSWLTGTQMMDGLALGETTPGPLIMIVSFVGFVGAWTKEIFGADALFLAGVAGASIATIFTFLPSFLFILLGAPMIEATRDDIKFTAPLSAITAAVVGVILNLATFFALHTFFPKGLNNSFEWFSVVIALTAFIALVKYKVSVVWVIGVSSIIGLGWTLLNI
jgi:chromate transporter